MRSILLFISIFVSNVFFAQDFSGIVIDSITQLPIDGVNLTLLKSNYRVSSNSLGCFTIPISSNDKVLISSIGYVSKTVNFENSKPQEVGKKIVLLVPKVEVLNVVNIASPKLKYRINKTIKTVKKERVDCSFQFETEICKFFDNPTKKRGKIKAVSIFLAKNQHFDYLSDFNIKFYEYDSITHLPKAEIYRKNIIVSPKNKSYKMKINLDSLNIKIPKNGICIGLEIINTKYSEPQKLGALIAPFIKFSEYSSKYTNELTWLKQNRGQEIKKFIISKNNVYMDLEALFQ
jgi:hypothetical protein